MKLQNLATLSAVISHGSFAAAAEQVHLTRSAVSLQMKQLEDYFGQPLFDRSGRNVRPTAFAKEVASTVDGALADIEALRRHSGQVLSGRVRLGLTGSVQTTLMPVAFADLLQRAPGIELRIEPGNTPELLNQLKAGQIDAAVIIRPLTGGSSRLHWIELMKEPMVLVVPRDLPPSSPARMLREQPWIRFDRQLVAGRMAAQFVEQLIPQKQALVDMESSDAIVAMVGRGIGVSVLPKLRREQLWAHAVREVALGPNGPERQIAFVCRKADAENRLIDRVRAAFADAVVVTNEERD